MYWDVINNGMCQNRSDPWRPCCGLDSVPSRWGHWHGTPGGSPVVSGTEVLAVDPLSPVGSEIGPPWIRLLLAHPTDAWSDWVLGNLEDTLMPWALSHAPGGIPGQRLLCCKAHSPAEGGTAVGDCRKWMPGPKVSLQNSDDQLYSLHQ